MLKPDVWNDVQLIKEIFTRAGQENCERLNDLIFSAYKNNNINEVLEEIKINEASLHYVIASVIVEYYKDL